MRYFSILIKIFLPLDLLMMFFHLQLALTSQKQPIANESTFEIYVLDELPHIKA